MSSVVTTAEQKKLFGDIFIRDSSLEKSICILDKDGKKCGAEIKGARPYNLKRHVRVVHPDFAYQIIENDISDVLEVDILNILAEMFTINGRPFHLFKDSAFSKMYKMLIQQIELNSKRKIHVDTKKVKEHIESTAQEMKEVLKREVKNKPIALMMDIATKNNRAILGINIQYIVDKEIVLRTLAMIRLKESHTGAHLAQVVVGILGEFGIELDQLFSVTTDNAGYMLLSSEILDEIAEENSGGTHYGEMSEEQIEEEFYRQLLKETEEEFLHYTTPEHVKSIPCGAHRFQLAIQDAFAVSSRADNLIGKVRSIMIKLRTPNLVNALNERNMKKPFLDNKTRWNGKYFMVKRCLELKEFIEMMAVTDATFKMCDSEWSDLDELHVVLQDCAEFTKTIQGVQIGLSDFYAEWIELRLKLQSKQHIIFVANLIKCMEKRGDDLLGDPLVLSALYLDMRYRVLLNTKPIQKQLAMNQLTLLWKRVQSLQSKPEDESTTGSMDRATFDTSGIENDTDLMGAYLDSLESNSYQPQTNTTSEDIMLKLQQFNADAEQKKREPKKRHPMDFWYENRQKMPELYELAKLVFAVCPTETSVERNFSGLSYVLNRYRCNLTDKNLETIMFVRLNKELFERVITKKQ